MGVEFADRRHAAGAAGLFAWLSLVVSLVSIAGCASQGAPAGGPQDAEPPVVVSSDPPPGALNVAEGNINVEFSEYVDRRSFQESAFLSPSAGALSFDWSGTSVAITTAETLRANTTYILTIGSDLKDTRNNTMGKSITLPFSTGAVIDSCSVSGRVDDPSPAGVMVYAYDVSGGRGDTLDPAVVEPDYLTQAGKDGSFTLPNLREGEYRLMAVRDAFKNLLYNVQADQFGMAVSDVRLAGDERWIDGLGFRLAAEDTLRPFLSGVRAGHASSIVLRFNEAVAVPGGVASIAISDTADGSRLDALGISPTDTSWREYVVATAAQDSGVVYRLSLGAFADRSGNSADSAGRAAVFAGGAGTDSLSPAFSFNLSRDSATGFLPLDTLRLTFDAPVDTAAFGGGFSLTGPGGAPVSGSLRWAGSMSALFDADRPFTPGAWYSMAVRLDSVRGLSGRRGPDSLLVRRFRVVAEKMLAGISGKVSVGRRAGRAGAGGTIVVEARNLSGSAAGRLRAPADSTGAFSIQPLPEGRYVLSAFVDRNGNGVHDCGAPHPVVFAEPFGLLADTLRLRPGWPIEGVRIDVGN